VFENRVLRRIFGLKRGEVKRGWRQFYNEELRDLYSSPNIIRIMQCNNAMGEKRNTYRLLVGKPEGKRRLGRPRRKWVDNFFLWILERCNGVMFTRLVWLRIGTGGELL
jgi:hypothetical protein